MGVRARRVMADYHINVFWSEEDDCYIADIPDLEFCSAHGGTPEDALREVLVAKEGWLAVARDPRASLFPSLVIDQQRPLAALLAKCILCE